MEIQFSKTNPFTHPSAPNFDLYKSKQLKSKKKNLARIALFDVVEVYTQNFGQLSQ